MSNNKTEKILASTDGLQKAQAPDFFYTRLMARMQRDSGRKESSFFLWRPAFLTTCLGLICIINIVVLINRQTSPASFKNDSNKAAIENFATEYNLINNGDLLQ